MRSSRDKHSFIQFYFDDWKAGTAHMARPVRSVYFDICLFNWDKRRPCPKGSLTLMLADLGQMGEDIVDALVEEGALVRDSHGSVHSPRALREAERAFGAWAGKSLGGRKARGSEDSSKSDEAKLEVSPTEPDSDSDSEPEEGLDNPSGPGPSDIAEAWNEMARGSGLAQVIKITDERMKRLKARIEDHGGQAIIDGIRQIPENDFLLGKGKEGWKANFDWLLQPKSCAKLLEGGYEQGRGKPSGWVD